jgi:hypothetical protein
MLDLVENEVHFALGVMAGLQHKPLAGSSKSVHTSRKRGNGLSL